MLPGIESKRKQVEQIYLTEIAEIRNKIDKEHEAMENHAAKLYPLPEKPKKSRELIDLAKEERKSRRE